MTEIEFIKACYDHRKWNIMLLLTARQRIRDGESAATVYASIIASLE